MAEFKQLIITDRGQALMAKMLAGTGNVLFTKISVSDTTYTDGQLPGLTSLSGVKQTTLISRVIRTNDVAVQVEGAVTNTDLSTGYYMRAIGLYAIDPDLGEILYAVTIASQAGYMPPYNGITTSGAFFKLVTTVSNASSVSLNVDPAAVATIGDIADLQNKISDLQAFVGYTDSDIVGVEVDFKNKKFTRLAGAVNRIPGSGFDNINAFGGRKRCILADDGKVLAYYGEAAYTETGALLQAVTKGGTTYAVGTKVQVMVEQPKFYYKVVPLQLDKVEYKEINTLAITAVPTSDGNVTINLDGKDFTVAVATSDNTTSLVATKIRAASFTGWTTGGSGSSVTFTAIDSGEKVTATFNGGTTGVTATVTKTVSGKVGKGFHMRKARYYISDVKKVGFKLHPAFISNGKEKNFIYPSAFEGSVFDKSAGVYLLADEQIVDFTASTGDLLSSIANAKPTSGVTQTGATRSGFRKLANNRGTGWQQAYAAIVAATQLLFTIEYASMNTQSKIGNGVQKTDDATSNMAELTGATTNLGNSSGAVTNTNGFNVVTYRGEENFWMNIWKFVDGQNIEAKNMNNLYVADNAFADDIGTSPYKDAGITLSRKDGYISAFGYNEEFDWLFFPSETTGDSSLPVGDYFYQNHTYNGWLIARLGGSWTYSSYGGGFCWSVTYASSSRGRDVGGRLVYVPDAA
jgi:hypothetical protein